MAIVFFIIFNHYHSEYESTEVDSSAWDRKKFNLFLCNFTYLLLSYNILRHTCILKLNSDILQNDEI